MTSDQIKIFSIFLVLGMIISALFDIFRVLRRNIKTSYLLTSIEDLLYLLISGYLFFKSVIIFASGNLRFYIFLAFALGITVYALTIKNFCDIILTVVIKAIVTIVKIVLLPIKFIKEQVLLFFKRKVANEKKKGSF